MVPPSSTFDSVKVSSPQRVFIADLDPTRVLLFSLMLAFSASPDLLASHFPISPVLEKLTVMASLFNHFALLSHGTFLTIVHRVLQIKLVPRDRHLQHHVDVEYMNRQLLWQTFTVPLS